MRKYCIAEKSRENHAGSKARNDAAKILESHGYLPVYMHFSQDKGGADKIKMAFFTLRDWKRLEKRTKSGDWLVIQYPLAMYPKISLLAVSFIRKMKKKKVKLLLLIHDLESLRGLKFRHEKIFLELADEVIVHNQRMQDYLENCGYRFKHVYRLGLFDYLAEPSQEKRLREKNTIAFAGNLKQDKCGFLNELSGVLGDLSLHLYGPNYSGAESRRLVFCGEYPPEALPQVMSEGWGLVWDGASAGECSGTYGQYLKYNNPHKLSLYLASGMPVILWKKAAAAPMIVDKKLGITVDSLEQLPGILKKITDEEYREILKNVEETGKRLRKGFYLGDVIGRIERNDEKDRAGK